MIQFKQFVLVLVSLFLQGFITQIDAAIQAGKSGNFMIFIIVYDLYYLILIYKKVNYVFRMSINSEYRYNQFSADSSSHHQSLWEWILMPQSYYNRGNTISSPSSSTKYPFSTTLRYPYNNLYYSSYNPYITNPNRNTFYNRYKTDQ